jgi:hypothetical protein
MLAAPQVAEFRACTLYNPPNKTADSPIQVCLNTGNDAQIDFYGLLVLPPATGTPVFKNLYNGGAGPYGTDYFSKAVKVHGNLPITTPYLLTDSPWNFIAVSDAQDFTRDQLGTARPHDRDLEEGKPRLEHQPHDRGLHGLGVHRRRLSGHLEDVRAHLVGREPVLCLAEPHGTFGGLHMSRFVGVFLAVLLVSLPAWAVEVLVLASAPVQVDAGASSYRRGFELQNLGPNDIFCELGGPLPS